MFLLKSWYDKNILSIYVATFLGVKIKLRIFFYKICEEGHVLCVLIGPIEAKIIIYTCIATKLSNNIGFGFHSCIAK